MNTEHIKNTLNICSEFAIFFGEIPEYTEGESIFWTNLEIDTENKIIKHSNNREIFNKHQILLIMGIATLHGYITKAILFNNGD